MACAPVANAAVARKGERGEQVLSRLECGRRFIRSPPAEAEDDKSLGEEAKPCGSGYEYMYAALYRGVPDCHGRACRMADGKTVG
jgi:hypothetical protein